MFKLFAIPSFSILVGSAMAAWFVPHATADISVLPHLLSVAVALSGVTVPLIIVYRAGVGPNIRVTIANKIENHLSGVSISREQLLQASTHARGNGGEHDHTTLVLLGEVYTAKDRLDHKKQIYQPFSPETKECLLKNLPKHQKWLSFFFDKCRDNRIALLYVATIGVLAAGCLLDLYLLYIRGGAFLSDRIYYLLQDTIVISSSIPAFR